MIDKAIELATKVCNSIFISISNNGDSFMRDGPPIITKNC